MTSNVKNLAWPLGIALGLSSMITISLLFFSIAIRNPGPARS